MSKLDKDQVIADFTAAYEKAHGKKPTIEAKSGWYSIDGGKNMRLAQLAEETEALTGATKKPAAKAEKPAAKKAEKPAKAVSKKPVAKKGASKTTSSGNGLTARELWRQKLEAESSLSRLPRGY